jgi:hypothetical protein
MKTYISIQLFCQGSLIVSNPLETETAKALLIEVPNGKWVGKDSNSLWIPKSICSTISEKMEKVSDDCIEVIRKIEIPQWFVIKNKL